jgi:hypothetical protein
MTEVSNEPIFEVARAMPGRLLDIANVSETVGALDTRLARIERRPDPIDTRSPKVRTC